MSDHAKIVLWLGFFMIAFGVVKNWSSLSSTIFGSTGGSGLYIPGIKAQQQTAKRSVTGTVSGSRL